MQDARAHLAAVLWLCKAGIILARTHAQSRGSLDLVGYEKL